MAITAIPLNPFIGAEIRGVDLSKPVDEASRKELYQLWLEHLILLFRDQDLSQEKMIEATTIFGEQAISNRKADLLPSGWAKLLPGIMLISNIRENGVAIGNLPDGEMWFHHDMLHVEKPHKGTCLYSMEVPSRGGNTRFASCYRAYETLAEPLKAKLQGRRGINSYRLGEAKRNDGMGVAQVNESTHPVFRTHEETGRKAVYVNRLMTVGVEGMAGEQALETLGAVFDHSENEEWVYEHVWRPHDFIVWDNRCSMHARTDFSAGERRLMMRTTIAGNVRPS